MPTHTSTKSGSHSGKRPFPALSGFVALLLASIGILLLVDAAWAVVPNTPASVAINSQPQPVSSPVGTGAMLSVSAIGAPPLSYQWFKEGTKLLGATNSTLAFTKLSVADGGNYFAVVSNPNSRQISSKAMVQVLTTPRNDLFKNRITLSGTNIVLHASTVLATTEPDEPNASSPSIWWTWVAPKDGILAIDSSENTFSPYLSIYVGSDLKSLKAVVPTFGWSGFCRVSKGTQYQIRLSSYGGNTGNTVLHLRVVDAPPNDSFSQRTPIVGTNVIVSGSNLYATSEPGELTPGFGATVWWTWTAPQNGAVTLNITNASPYLYPRMYVFTGDSLASLRSVSSSYTQYGPTFQVSAGTQYQISVDSSFEEGPFSLALQFWAPPANDDFANRQELAGNDLDFTINNLGATFEPGETNASSNGGSLWWSWTAPLDGYATVDTYGYFGTVYAYQGDSLTNLVRVGTGSLGFVVRAGQKYEISFNGSPYGNIHLNFHAWQVAPNAYFSSATSQVGQGSPAQFVAEVFTGSPPLTFQWFFNGVPVSGATNSTLTISNTIIANSGTYTFIVTNPAGAASNSINLTVFPAPINDFFSNRVSLGSTATDATGYTFGATTEPGEPTAGNSEYQHTIWYSWTAPADGTAQVQFTSTGWSPALAVYTGPSVTSLTPVAGESGCFRATAGTEYEIDIAAHFDGFDTVYVQFAEPPTNDAFANRIQLEGRDLHLTGSTFGATKEQGEPGDTNSASLWWTWTAPGDGFVAIANKVEYSSPTLSVFTGSHVDALASLIAVSDNNVKSIAVQQGVTYQIRVESEFGSQVPFDFELVLFDNINNDMFTNRATLIGTNAFAYIDNSHATVEPNEPNPAHNGGVSVWWSWTAPISGTVFLDGTTLFGFQNIISVYTGDALPNLTEIASTGNNFDHLSFYATANTTYQIQLDSNCGFGSVRILHLNQYPAPTNDNFADRATLAGSDVTVIGNTASATLESGEPLSSSFTNEVSVWWSWTAPSNDIVTIDFAGTRSNPMVRVYTNDTLSSLQPVYQSGNSFFATAGVTYQLRVFNNPIAGSFTMNVRSLGVPENDLFQNRIHLAPINYGSVSHTANATSEPGEPIHNNFGRGRSVWWDWTAPSDGVGVVEVNSSDLSVAVYTGDSVTNLTPLPILRDEYQFYSYSFTAFAGTNYKIAIDNTQDELFAQTDFTLQVHETQHGPQNIFNLPNDVTTVGRPTSLSLAVVSTPPITYQWQFNGNDIPGATNSTFLLASPTTNDTGSYEVRISTPYGSQTYSGSLTVFPPPANDNFSDRIPLVGTNVQFEGRLEGATLEPGELSTNDHSHGSIWWTWTAPANGTVVVSSYRALYSGTLTVYSGDTLDSLNKITQIVADGSVGNFNVVAGQSYQISFEGDWNNRMRLDPRSSLQFIAHAKNDLFQQAIVLSGTNVIVKGTNAAATIEPGEPTFDGQIGASVWYRWKAPATGAVTLSLLDASFPASIAVYIGRSIEAQHLVDASTFHQFRAETGKIYNICIAGTNADCGSFTFQLSEKNDIIDPTDGVIVINAMDSGHYDQTGFHDKTDKSYDTGLTLFGEDRGYFVFQIPQFSGRVTSAKLCIDSSYLNGFTSSDFHRVATPVAELMDNNAGKTDIFNHLGSGNRYSDGWFDSLFFDPTVNFGLNSRFLQDVSSARGSRIALGARTDLPLDNIYPRLIPPQAIQLVLSLDNSAPVILKQPSAPMIPAGNDLVLTVAASGTDLKYQWQLNDKNVVGQTANQLYISPLTSAWAGNIRAIVSNSSGSTASSNVVVRLIPGSSNQEWFFPNTISGTNIVTFGSSTPNFSTDHAPYVTGSSLWWTWTAPCDGNATINTSGSSFHTVVSVYESQDSSPADPPLAVAWPLGSQSWSLLQFHATQGITYFVSVDGFRGESGRIRLHLTQRPD